MCRQIISMMKFAEQNFLFPILSRVSDMVKKPDNLDFKTWSNVQGHNLAKVPKFKYKASILLIGNFLLITNNPQFPRFQLPGNC
jgi:hypothetical protein